MSVARGTGIAIPARGVTPRATTTATRSLTELAQEWKWSGRYPEQPEIERYLNHVADRFDLRRDIELSTRVTAATFDDSTNRWEIRTDHDDTVTARFLVTAVGCLSAPIAPDIPGSRWLRR